MKWRVAQHVNVWVCVCVDFWDEIEACLLTWVFSNSGKI